ncbi:MAG: pantoate--beta-alanine ligase [Desulfovibrionales bacterium]|nr:pantoate--beta-alanine ligase [Desulfovibrionales bacterium]
MKIIKSVARMQSLAMQKRTEGKRIALVPTMGFFHAGHISLMTYARKRCDLLVVSIFVNPMQFGPSEDLERYPRDLKRDRVMAEKAGADVLFCPSAQDMYPRGFQTYVEVEQLTQPLCGRRRPGHFRGVTTVVTKLFNIVQPHEAIFGLKDYQQWLTIRRMAGDLNMAVKVTGRPIVREKDGLAMSSRNTCLSPAERKAALSLQQAISVAKDLVRKGEKGPERIKKAIKELITSYNSAKIEIEYISFCHPETLDERDIINDKTLLAIAARVGKTRLIDNCLLSPGE